VDAAEVLGEMRLVGQTLGGRGETDALLGDLPLGKVTVTRALQIAREHDDRLTECESLRVLGVIARMSGDLPEAIRLGEMSVEVAEDVRNHWMLAWTTAEMGESLLASDRAEDARATFSAAASRYAKIGADIRSDRLLDRVKEIYS
jgi:hypothetical protein